MPDPYHQSEISDRWRQLGYFYQPYDSVSPKLERLVMPLSSLSCQLFIATDHGYSEQVEAYCQQNFGSLTIHRGGRSEPFPESAYDWSGDLIISYVSRWIIPESVLNQAQLAAINFHPGSPDYPGTGCINFALYDEAKTFGATCHHMKAKVDTGKLISTIEFDLLPDDNVESLLQKTHSGMHELFYRTMEELHHTGKLPESSVTWGRKPYTRKELNQLSLISTADTEDEVRRKIRATSFGPWQPRIELHGHTFEYKPNP